MKLVAKKLRKYTQENGVRARIVSGDLQQQPTDATTRRTLSLLWGTTALPGRAAQAEAWYRGLLETQGATTRSISEKER